MDIANWLKEQSGQAYEYAHDLAVIPVSDLKELLKTHTIVPNEPTEDMLNIVRLDYGGSGYSFIKTYESLLKASQVKTCHHQ